MELIKHNGYEVRNLIDSRETISTDVLKRLCKRDSGMELIKRNEYVVHNLIVSCETVSTNGLNSYVKEIAGWN